MRMPLIAGNWKMNGSLALVEAFGRGFADISLPVNVEVALMVPFPFLEAAGRALVDRAAKAGLPTAQRLQGAGYDLDEVTPDADNWKYAPVS